MEVLLLLIIIIKGTAHGKIKKEEIDPYQLKNI